MAIPSPGTNSSVLFPRDDVHPPPRSRWRVIRLSDQFRFSAGWLILVAVIVTLLLFSVLAFPDLIVTEPKGIGQLHGTDLVTAENALQQTRNSVRGTLVQAIGGALVLLTFAVGFGQLMTARRGQITDRFTKTIDQIGNDKVDVRLGGIYALQQIAASREYARPVAEIYAAYLKTHASAASDESGRRGGELGKRVPRFHASRLSSREPVTSSSDRPAERTGLSPDLQAVLRILVLERLWNKASPARLDLSRINVSRAELPNAQLANCILLQASLVRANLEGADLSSSDLREINLTGALLRDADLGKGDLSGATLVEADLDNAELYRALFYRANLRGAKIATSKLWKTDFTECDLRDADFSGAYLEETIFTSANLSRVHFAGATLIGVNLTRSDLTGADFTGAKLINVALAKANLKNTQGIENVI
jgi:uncharacterized protein YjbI with pentapeptide repeats